MKIYNILGNEIPERILTFHSYDVTLTDNNNIYIHTSMNQIDVIDYLTENKNITLFDEFGVKTTIFRKHIIKIKEVK